LPEWHELGYLEEPETGHAVDNSWCPETPGWDCADPHAIPTYPDGHVLMDKEEELLDNLEKCWDNYNQSEATIKAQIYTTVPDSILIEVCNLVTEKVVQDAMCAKHETKVLTIKVDMQCCMYELKCEDDTNVCTHLESLMKMHEQLAGMNTALTDEDLVMIILGSLPKWYHPLISVITMSTMHAKAKLEPDQVVGMLINEFKRLAIEERQLKASVNTLTAVKGHGKHQGHNNAFSTTKSDVEC
jgi:hypothetical protein